MKKHYIVLIVILIAAGSFLAGSWVTYQGGRSKTSAERKILHYVDPMNPAFKSDKPGIAPCGMPLEPVYADQGDAGGADLRASLPPGTIRISPEKQQMIGVKTATVQKASWSHTLRVLGRVTPDETRVYRIKAAVSGWIQETPPVTTGSLVKEHELLATFSFYSAEYRTALLAYLNTIKSSNISQPGRKAEEEPPTLKSISKTKELRAKEYENIRLTGRGDSSSQVDYYKQILLSYGVSEAQLREMERTRNLITDIEILAPASGFILFRNVSPGQRFDKGEELFRIADLSQVWIQGDIFETEASYFKPGMRVKMELPYQKKILYAQVSPVLPQFDPATRTLKVRLEADNPGYVMRPDMLVNVELPVNGPPAIIVPVDAVLDSGLKRTVFVDKGNGFFEPRQVEIGRTLGERIEIARGLVPGEKIVVSGNFLIDSEARMQQAASGIFGKIGRDPVCRMNIDEDRAKTEGNVRDYKGKSYFFCSPECLAEFDKDPERYLKSSPPQGGLPIAGSQDAAAKHPSHTPAPVPRSRGAKSAPETHDGMTMPRAKSPAAMPGMPAAAPTTESKTGGMAIPSVAAPPGMAPPLPALPGQERMPMSMPQGVAPMSGPQVGGMTPPSATPGMGPQSSSFPVPGPGDMPMPGPQGAAPMPSPLPDRLSPSPAPVIPGMGPGSPASPGPGGMPMLQSVMPGMTQQPTLPGTGQGGMPMPQGAAPMPVSPGSAQKLGGKAGEMPPSMPGAPGMNQGPQDFPMQRNTPGPMPQAAPMPESQTGEIAPPAPATRTPSRPPRTNPRLQQYRLPGNAPETGPQGAVPMPGGKAGEILPPAADHPDVKQ